MGLVVRPAPELVAGCVAPCSFFAPILTPCARQSVVSPTKFAMKREPLLEHNPKRCAVPFTRSCSGRESDNRRSFVLLPIHYQQIWDFYKRAVASFWTAEVRHEASAQ